MLGGKDMFRVPRRWEPCSRLRPEGEQVRSEASPQPGLRPEAVSSVHLSGV